MFIAVFEFSEVSGGDTRCVEYLHVCKIPTAAGTNLGEYDHHHFPWLLVATSVSHHLLPHVGRGHLIGHDDLMGLAFRQARSQAGHRVRGMNGQSEMTSE